MVELKYLSKLCPVWLDDFGRGLTSLTIIDMFNFECIKLIKIISGKYRVRANSFKIINKVKPYCNFVIVEGVETIEQKTKYMLLLIALARKVVDE